METEKKMTDILVKYGIPDPALVGKLPKGGINLSFVGHADVTKMLIETDPMWTWEPVAFDDNGLPAYRVENGKAHMAGWLTVHGVRRLGIGSVEHNKSDLLKELVSDFLRNAAMRFGFCLSLWTKQEWEDMGATPIPATATKTNDTPRPTPSAKTNGNRPLSEEQIIQFNKACEAKGIDPSAVASNAGVVGRIWQEKDLPALRESFKELISFKEGE